MSSTIAMRGLWSPMRGLSTAALEAAKLSDKLIAKLAVVGAIPGFEDYRAAPAAEFR